MADETFRGEELFIHLGLDGLRALKATEAAMATGRGRIELAASAGLTARTGASPFASPILTFGRDRDPGEPLPPPRLPAERVRPPELALPA